MSAQGHRIVGKRRIKQGGKTVVTLCGGIPGQDEAGGLQQVPPQTQQYFPGDPKGVLKFQLESGEGKVHTLQFTGNVGDHGRTKLSVISYQL
jgi:hypothetical protein